MTKFYLLFLTMACGIGAFAQTVVVPANLNTDPDTPQFPFTYIDAYIEADTTASGEQNNDTYLLEAGGVYFFIANRTWAFDVTIGATGDVATLGRPVVDRANPTGGTTLPQMYTGTGSFYWDNIYLIMGDEGPTQAAYETRPFNPFGVGKTYSFNNCVIEKIRQGPIRSEGDSVKIFVTNNHLYNFGDYEIFQGNGRIVDIRTAFADSVVIKNNVMHNFLDRAYIGFRQRGLNYFEFSSNTVFNHVGRHGFIQLSNTKESVIRDNFIQNPIMLGSTPGLADEQLNLEGIKNVVFSLDTLKEGGSVTMENNNIHWTQDVLDYYASYDTVSKPDMFSPTFIAALGDTTNAYFSEVLELDNVPSRARLIEYSNGVMTDRKGVQVNIMVEDESLEGENGYDNGYFFDFSKFNPCYEPNSRSATAATNNTAVGATKFCADLINSVKPLAYNRNIQLTARPNPTTQNITFKYELLRSGPVQFLLYDYTGKQVASLFQGEQLAGSQVVRFDGMGQLASGMYIANIRTPEGRMYVKVIKQ